MFTGIVEDLGEVEAVEHLGDSARIHVRSAVVTADTRPGDSIAVNGVCLTVTVPLAEPPGSDRSALPPRGFVADVMGETLKRSSLAAVAPGTKVNLERSVRLEDRLGGHLVQGHVDDTAAILHRAPHEHWEVVRIGLPPGLARYVAHKGSIAVDGISLTVVSVDAASFTVSLIPHTTTVTVAGRWAPGSTVNLEADMVAKYVEKGLTPYAGLAGRQE